MTAIWEGRTVICIASGPSLTAEDCELVHASGHPVVVTNTTFRMCPWADVLFGFDSKWWKLYREEVTQFRGEKLSASRLSEKYGARTLMLGYRNSGACAVALAMSRGAARIVLLAYDLMFWDGRRHWHGDHPAPLENASTIVDWARQFGMLAKSARRRGVEIVNASRRTRLTCFPIVSLEAALAERVAA